MDSEGISYFSGISKKSILREPLKKSPPLDFNIEKYSIYKGKPFEFLNDEDIIDIGDRKLEILHTPGYSPGHCCFYDRGRGYLFSGDLIYKGTLYAFYPSTDPLKFKKSVDRVAELTLVNRILPGHNDLQIETGFIEKVRSAFGKLQDCGLLKHGSGLHKIQGFEIFL